MPQIDSEGHRVLPWDKVLFERALDFLPRFADDSARSESARSLRPKFKVTRKRTHLRKSSTTPAELTETMPVSAAAQSLAEAAHATGLVDVSASALPPAIAVVASAAVDLTAAPEPRPRSHSARGPSKGSAEAVAASSNHPYTRQIARETAAAEAGFARIEAVSTRSFRADRDRQRARDAAAAESGPSDCLSRLHAHQEAAADAMPGAAKRSLSATRSRRRRDPRLPLTPAKPTVHRERLFDGTPVPLGLTLKNPGAAVRRASPGKSARRATVSELPHTARSGLHASTSPVPASKLQGAPIVPPPLTIRPQDSVPVSFQVGEILDAAVIVAHSVGRAPDVSMPSADAAREACIRAYRRLQHDLLVLPSAAPRNQRQLIKSGVSYVEGVQTTLALLEDIAFARLIVECPTGRPFRPLNAEVARRRARAAAAEPTDDNLSAKDRLALRQKQARDKASGANAAADASALANLRVEVAESWVTTASQAEAVTRVGRAVIDIVSKLATALGLAPGAAEDPLRAVDSLVLDAPMLSQFIPVLRTALSRSAYDEPLNFNCDAALALRGWTMFVAQPEAAICEPADAVTSPPELEATSSGAALSSLVPEPSPTESDVPQTRLPHTAPPDEANLAAAAAAAEESAIVSSVVDSVLDAVVSMEEPASRLPAIDDTAANSQAPVEVAQPTVEVTQAPVEAEEAPVEAEEESAEVVEVTPTADATEVVSTEPIDDVPSGDAVGPTTPPETVDTVVDTATEPPKAEAGTSSPAATNSGSPLPPALSTEEPDLQPSAASPAPAGAATPVPAPAPAQAQAEPAPDADDEPSDDAPASPASVVGAHTAPA
jgi:hypothetical protein